MNPRWKPSVTVAAIIERQIDGRSEFLMVEEETPEGLQLNNPAGHLEPSESPQEGVIREVLEETARSFEPRCIVGVYLSRFERRSKAQDVTYVRFAFAGEVGPADPLRQLDEGIVRTIWMSLEELQASRARHRSPQVMRGVEDYLAGRRYPLGLVATDRSVYEPEIKGE